MIEFAFRFTIVSKRPFAVIPHFVIFDIIYRQFLVTVSVYMFLIPIDPDSKCFILAVYQKK